MEGKGWCLQQSWVTSRSGYHSEPSPIHLYHTDKRLKNRRAARHSCPCREHRRHVHIANDIGIWLLVEGFVSDP